MPNLEMRSEGPLAGVTVIEIATAIQGPYAAMLLADMGADVLKIEPTGGDRIRGPGGESGSRSSPMFFACNRNKQSIAIDHRSAEGRQLVKKLIGKADVFLHNLSPGAVDAMGLDYQALSSINPRLVYAAASGFGHVGSRTKEKSADIIAQAEGGLIAHTGHDPIGPAPAGASIADHVGALWMAWGVVVALFSRERTGTGQRVDSSLVGGQLGIQAFDILATIMLDGKESLAGFTHPLLGGTWGLYRAGDGWFALGVVLPGQWISFCEALNLLHLANDTRFRDLTTRDANRDSLRVELQKRFEELPMQIILDLCRSAGVMVGEVRNYRSLTNDPDLRENRYIINWEMPDGRSLPAVGYPVHLSAWHPSPRMPPDLDANADQVLRAAGLEAPEIGRLRRSGVIGRSGPARPSGAD